MRSSTTKIVCDYEKDGAACGKCFLIPDPPEQPTAGVEDTVAVTIAAENKTYFFCGMLHMIAWATARVKASAPAPRASKTGFSDTQLQTLKEMGIIVSDAPKESRAHAAVEELESLPRNIPPVPDDLRLD